MVRLLLWCHFLPYTVLCVDPCVTVFVHLNVVLRCATPQEAQFRHCTLDHLEVSEEPIASGASAEVFSARVHVSADSPFDGSVQGRRFALKKLKDYGATRENRIAQMAKDFDIPRRYPHMFIVHCLAQFDGPTIHKEPLEEEIGQGQTSYVVMSLANKTLGQYVEEREPLDERAVRTGQATACALAMCCVLCLVSCALTTLSSVVHPSPPRCSCCYCNSRPPLPT